jgi:hypothetical protein
MGLRVSVGVGEAFLQAAPYTLRYGTNAMNSPLAQRWYLPQVLWQAHSMGSLHMVLRRTLDGANGLAAWKWIFIIEGKNQMTLSTRGST